MHDCRKTKEELIDLAFNEVDAGSALRLMEELEACSACRSEYQAIEEALAKFDEAAPSLLPASEFWTEHHARIESRIENFSGAASVVPFWRRALRTSFSIPVPVAVAAALLLAATSVMAVRSFIFKQDARQLRGAASEAKVQYVEVPVEKRVVEERVVTRTVYVTRKGAPQASGPVQPMIQDIPGMTAQNKDETKATRTTLNGFQPTSDVKLTVIKGSLNDGK